MKRASIIISVDNSFAIIDNFFQILYSFIAKDTYEIIVIDDCCTDLQTVLYLKQLREKSLIDILITLTKKHGFGKANNIGVKSSTTDCLIFMNTDIIIDNNIIDRLTDIYYEKNGFAFNHCYFILKIRKFKAQGTYLAPFLIGMH